LAAIKNKSKISTSPKGVLGIVVMNNILLCADSLRNIPIPALKEDVNSSRETFAARVLVVDDEVLIADTIVMILNRHGFIAEAVYSGTQAIEAARRISPELILSDVLMPQIDGVEAAIAIREFLPEARIVLFSGQAATVEILARARARGHDFELLPKPIHPPNSSSTSAPVLRTSTIFGSYRLFVIPQEPAFASS
jgi:CheY-like chemotaxis protein